MHVAFFPFILLFYPWLELSLYRSISFIYCCYLSIWLILIKQKVFQYSTLSIIHLY